MLRRLFKREKGQVLVMMAAMMFVILGMGSLVVDIGHLMVEKHKIQNAADAASLAGVIELPRSSSDARAKALEFNNKNGVSAAETDSITITNGDTIEVRNSRTVHYFLAGVFGIVDEDVEAHAKAKARVVTGFRFDQGDAGPFLVWAGHPRNGLDVGDVVIFMSNQYQKDNDIEDGNPDWAGNSNNFKGFLRSEDGVVYHVNHGPTIESGGGVACGHQMRLNIEEYVDNPDKFLILPVADTQFGNGSNQVFDIIAWAAVAVTDYDCPKVGEGVVLEFKNSPFGFIDGPTQPDPDIPGVYTSSLID